MTVFTVRHTTTYRYKRPVEFGEHGMFFRHPASESEGMSLTEIVQYKFERDASAGDRQTAHAR